MPHKDIRKFAKLVGSRLDSAKMKKFLAEWNVTPEIDDSDDYPVGEIAIHTHGFDLILAFNNKWGHPRSGGKSSIWVSSMRFFAPEYAKKRKIVPYSDSILKDLVLPATQQDVRNLLGRPTTTCKDGQSYDEYQQEDCVVRFHYFHYPSGDDCVVFVELDLFSMQQRRHNYKNWEKENP